MSELVLLLLGARLIRRKWWIVLSIGLIWLAIGTFFLINGLIDETRLPTTFFALPLLVDAVFSTVAGLNMRGTGRTLRFSKAAVFILLALLIVGAPVQSGMLIGFIAGTFLVVDAIWRATSAYIVRHARWRLSLVNAGIEFLLGVWSYIPYPSNWQGEVESDVGTLMMASAAGICMLAIRIRNLPPSLPISTVLMHGWPAYDESPPIDENAASDRAPPEAATVTVHVWTPTGSLISVRRGISRYVVALDEKGTLSTGHAALDAPPDIYISHYPAVEISRSRSEFPRTLRATPDNDVPGVFQPSYREESEDWCASTRKVRLEGLDIPAIRTFWTAYRRDPTYNLTSRNCSSAVAKALDAGLEGIFATHATSPYFLVRLVFLPELWVAGELRRRAAAMTWTPGIVLDYARALSHVVALPPRLGRGPRRPSQRSDG